MSFQKWYDREFFRLFGVPRDSGRLPKGEDPPGAECEASQSGHEVASPTTSPDHIPQGNNL